jgi:hypothetical protein
MLRDNYTVEVAGFEDAVREVAIRAVKATFTKITLARLGSYLNLEGLFTFRVYIENDLKSICCRSSTRCVCTKTWVETRRIKFDAFCAPKPRQQD